MGKGLRNKDPEIYRLITNRTLEARLWMLPSRNMEKLLGGIIARYAEFLGIEIYAYVFLSNHYHLLVRAPKQNIDEFCEHLNREIARRVNWKLQRLGNFWPDPYADQPVLSEDDLLEAFLYITTNPVKHGLVPHPKHWPGLNSYHHNLTERDRAFTFYYYSAPDPKDIPCKHSLKLSVLPQFEGLTREQRRKKISALVEERAALLVEERKSLGQGFLGADKLLLQEPGSIPREVARSPRPCAYTKNPELRREARRLKREREAAYRNASYQYRLGDFTVEFPEYSFKPPLHRRPRSSPFIPVEDLKNVA